MVFSRRRWNPLAIESSVSCSSEADASFVARISCSLLSKQLDTSRRLTMYHGCSIVWVLVVIRRRVQLYFRRAHLVVLGHCGAASLRLVLRHMRGYLRVRRWNVVWRKRDRVLPSVSDRGSARAALREISDVVCSKKARANGKDGSGTFRPTSMLLPVVGRDSFFVAVMIVLVLAQLSS